MSDPVKESLKLVKEALCGSVTSSRPGFADILEGHNAVSELTAAEIADACSRSSAAIAEIQDLTEPGAPLEHPSPIPWVAPDMSTWVLHDFGSEACRRATEALEKYCDKRMNETKESLWMATQVLDEVKSSTWLNC